MFGREPHVPLDLMFCPPPGERLSSKEWVAILQRDLRNTFQLCHEHISFAQKCQKANCDRDLKAKYVQYDLGTYVMLFDPMARGKYDKLNKAWRGPFKVIERTGPVTYRVETENEKKMYVNYNRLKAVLKDCRSLQEGVQDWSPCERHRT